MEGIFVAAELFKTLSANKSSFVLIGRIGRGTREECGGGGGSSLETGAVVAP